MNRFAIQVTLFAFLVVWICVQVVAGNGLEIVLFKQMGQRVVRQTSTGPQDPQPAPGPAGYVYKLPNCNCQATSQFFPVCGSNGFTYVNRQLLECAASCGTKVTFRRSGPCGRGLSSAVERPSVEQ